MIRVRERITYVDTLKGICILMVVFMHCGLLVDSDNELARHINDALRAYRLPTYYFLSGVFFKTYSGMNEFARRKINNIFIPLLFFYGLCFVGSMLISCITGWIDGHGPDMEWGALLDVFYRTEWRVRSASPLWFLLSLLWVNLIFYILKSRLNIWAVCIMVLLLAIAGYVLESNQIILPLRIGTSMVALPYFVLGYYVKRMGWLQARVVPWIGVLQLFVVAAVVVLLARDYTHIDSIGMFLYHRYVIPFASIMSLFWFCKCLPRRVPVVTFLGRYSLIVLGTHMFLIVYISLIQSRAFAGVSEWLWRTCMFILIVALELLIVPFMRDHFPRFTAQKEFLKPS